MLRGYRGIILALGLIIVAGLFYAGYDQIQSAEKPRYTEYKYQPARDRVSPSPSKKPEVAAKPYQPYCNGPEDRDDADLCAQWAAVQAVGESNRLTRLSITVTALEFGALIISLFFTGWAALAASRATKIAEDATKDADRALEIADDSAKASKAASEAMKRQVELMADAQRPWLDFDILEIEGARYSVMNDNLKVKLRIFNHSAFPAHSVRGAGYGHFYQGSLLDPLVYEGHRESVTGALDDLSVSKTGEITHSTIGDVVFPQKERTPDVIVTIADPGAHKDKGGTGAMVRITVGIRYVYDGGAGYTFRDYHLVGVEPALVQAKRGQTISKNDLSYQRITFTSDDNSGRAS
jgi:hypothetical protein